MLPQLQSELYQGFSDAAVDVELVDYYGGLAGAASTDGRKVGLARGLDELAALGRERGGLARRTWDPAPRGPASPSPPAPPPSRTARPHDAEAMRDASGLNATDWTVPSCPWRPTSFSPLPASQSRTVSSHDPDAMRDPSGLNATE